jgi:phenylpropionate dioxygenase-like ring-hydroxylating dioxygenase large terminal subunit
MGALMREYWVPAMLASEVARPDADPVRVMLLGEKLIGFRDTSGRVGLIQNSCPHRGASLFFGRNEVQGLRCVYHGWKFDAAGSCVDMPNEPPESDFRTRIKAQAYPCVERAGIVWAYLGPRATPPPLPGLEALDLAEGEWDVGAAMRDCNWLQGLEGDLDTSHVYFLHYGAVRPEDTQPGTPAHYQATHKNPRFALVDTDFGAMYGAYRPAGRDRLYWRIAQFLFPFWAHIPLDRNINHRAWVPMDDSHTMFFLLRQRPQDPAQQATGNRWIPDGGKVPTQLAPANATGWYGRFRLQNSASNDYLLDRQAQRSGESFTGIPGVFAQDHAVTETMGAVFDRSSEHLGSSDVMVIRLRQRLIEAATALVDKGTVPPGVDDPDVFRTRSCSVVLPETADWLQATNELRLVAPSDG